MSTLKRRLSAKEIAQETGIGYSTAKKWVHDFEIPAQRIAGRPMYDSEVVEIFDAIKRLKQDGSGNETIQRFISPAKSKLSKSHGGHDPALAPLPIDIRAEMKAAFAESSELAEKYARATYELGQFQERIRCLEIEKEKLEGRLLLLPDSTEWKITQENQAQQAYKIAELKASLENVKSENEALKKTVQEEQKRSWWDKLIGRKHA